MDAGWEQLVCKHDTIKLKVTSIKEYSFTPCFNMNRNKLVSLLQLQQSEPVFSVIDDA